MPAKPLFFEHIRITKLLEFFSHITQNDFVSSTVFAIDEGKNKKISDEVESDRHCHY